MQRLFIATSIFLLAAGAPLLAANAAGAPPSPKVDCRNAETQMDLDFCAGKDFTAEDGKLNAIYATLMKKYGASDRATLKTAEKKWLAYRNAECSYETADTVGGSIHPMVETECRTEKTTARVKELQTQLDCQEGDTSCNLPNKMPPH